jgi:hypothetical protein
MYVEIHSRNDESSAHSGKTSWTNSDKVSCVAMRTAPDHLGMPPWHIELSTSRAYEVSNGERGGSPKSMIRTALVQLTAKDLALILHIAASEGIIPPTAMITKNE